ncbi:MAG: phytanoyl-CoA dioxygenase family protein [Candidatus Latescibacteria bacterium]|nr:phytanoyl-CoA dioxygenase family protein [Candidatus Latescibacterota bacterium]
MADPDAWRLSPEQVTQYHRDGYLVVPDLLSREEVEAFRRYNEEVFAGLKKTGLTNHLVDETWARTAAHPRIKAALTALMGGPPMCIQTMMLAKMPEGKGIAIHQDSYYIETEPETLMACWIALDDTDAGNGGLCVVPDSHRGPLLQMDMPQDATQHASWTTTYEYRDRSGKTWAVPLHSAEVKGWDSSREVTLAVPAGGAVFFTGCTIHGSHRNASSERPRRAFACHYVREGSWVYRTDIQQQMPL